MSDGVLATYFAMGGYARFVWPGYILGLVLLVGLLLLSLRGARAREAELARLQSTRPARTPRRPAAGQDHALPDARAQEPSA